MPAHKNNTENFRDLDYREQAKAINAEIANLLAAIRHHAHLTRRRPNTKAKCVRQIQRLLNHVLSIP